MDASGSHVGADIDPSSDAGAAYDQTWPVAPISPRPSRARYLAPPTGPRRGAPTGSAARRRWRPRRDGRRRGSEGDWSAGSEAAGSPATTMSALLGQARGEVADSVRL